MEEENVKQGRHTKKRKLNKKKIITICIILILMISTVIIVFTHNKKETSKEEVTVNMGKHGEYSRYPKKLIGSWTTDGVTIYHFDNDGTGYLRTSLKDYVFTYSIMGNKLYINFADETSTDSDYVISIKGKTLELTGINKTTGTYTLTKQ